MLATAFMIEEEGGREAVVGLILGAIGGYIVFHIILKEIAKDNAANKVTITPAEEKDRDERIENIEKDIQSKIANLDNEIRKEILKKTDEQIDKEFKEEKIDKKSISNA